MGLFNSSKHRRLLPPPRRLSEKKKTFNMKDLLILAFLATSAVCVIGRPQIYRSAEGDVMMSDEEALEVYGIIDMIPGVGDLIEKLKPLIMEKIAILMDPNMTMQEKIQAIMNVVKEHAGDIVQIVGDFGLKVIIQTILPGIIASLGR